MGIYGRAGIAVDEREAAAVRDQRERSALLCRATMQTEQAFTISVAAQWRLGSVKFEEQTLQSEELERQLRLA
jgi:hypothetical protein